MNQGGGAGGVGWEVGGWGGGEAGEGRRGEQGNGISLARWWMGGSISHRRATDHGEFIII